MIPKPSPPPLIASLFFLKLKINFAHYFIYFYCVFLLLKSEPKINSIAL